MEPKEKKITAYMRIYNETKAGIISGRYPYMSKLPSKRTMSDESGVSVITVEHAYAILCDEGYVEAREKSGYFVIYRESDFNSRESDLSSGESAPPLSAPLSAGHIRTDSNRFPYSVLAKTMRRVLLDYGERILVKSPNLGTPELRAAISGYLTRSCGIHARPAQIIIGSGAEYLYNLIIMLLGKDIIFALEDPSYEKIRRVYEASGVKYEMLKLAPDGIPSAELKKSRAKVLHVTPFNSFPSGVTVGATKRREYLDFAGERDGYIIEDNYDSELTVSRKYEETIFSLSEKGSVIYLNTFSRTIAPSMRAGYMVLSPELSERFEKTLGFYSCTVPVFEQYVIAGLIGSGDYERHINRVRRARRRALNGK